jgi:N-methylhydantoinase A/oxoprolinase/acetone carboxylase beta subunit
MPSIIPGSGVLGIDTGGTFTDFVLVQDGALTVHKLPSTPGDPSQSAGAGMAQMPLPDDATVAHGSTVATNALLERKGARTALVTTAGFEDVLQIGRQARHDLYALEYQAPEPLVPAELRLGVAERVDATGAVLQALTAEEVSLLLERVAGLNVDAVAISLLFSFLHPGHERAIADAVHDRYPALFVSTSSDVLPEYREYERTSTVAVNAYVGPLMSTYLSRMRDLTAHPLRIMQSSGGSITVDMASRQPVRTILSGPAGGVMGAQYVAEAAGYSHIITFDMGGTSTDVSLCPGHIQTTTGYAIGVSPIGVPVIDIHTVGAGGGSIAQVDVGGALRVGPESAGADPGPACYGVGSDATVTDANLVLERMAPSHFLGGRMALDAGRAVEAIGKLAAAMNAPVERAALGVVQVANAVMERALRTVSLERGHDPRDFTLVAFGGAGPQHACELAAALDIPRVLVPLHPGLLSALGVAMADVVKDYSRTVMIRDAGGMAGLEAAFAELETQGRAEMTAEGFQPDALEVQRSLDVRYRGQSFELPVEWPDGDSPYDAMAAGFHQAHLQRFGYMDERNAVEVVNARLRIVAPTARPELEHGAPHQGDAPSDGEAPVWFEAGTQATHVYDREALHAGHRFKGPALVYQMDATTVVPPGWQAEVDSYRNLILIPESA